MQQLIAPLAKQQGWQNPQVQLQHELPTALPAQACSQPLAVKRTGDDPSPLARQRFVLNCADTPAWKINAVSQATVFVAVVFASVPLERGQSIAAEDLKLQPVNIAKASRGYFNQVEQVAGLSAKRRIREGQMLSPALLAGAVLVKRGQQVEIRASQDGIQARAVGEALGNGQLGEVIKVRNLGSEKVIEGKVIEAGVVSSTFR
ncbi:flagella basal body P-ring formation protein FlgA [Pseudomonas sp. TE3786]